MTFAEAFAAQLKSARRKAGITQEEVSYRAGLDSTTVSILERGLASPRLVTVLRLAGALEIEPAELIPAVRWRTAPKPTGEWVEEQPSEDQLTETGLSESL
ncbi:MAG TPA: helix-turn-helix transcriptional regulator [Polyangia bacterium]|nr:helix-turn-helix transcriptional regulator [Polyangia bacterium]